MVRRFVSFGVFLGVALCPLLVCAQNADLVHQNVQVNLAPAVTTPTPRLAVPVAQAPAIPAMEATAPVQVAPAAPVAPITSVTPATSAPVAEASAAASPATTTPAVADDPYQVNSVTITIDDPDPSTVRKTAEQQAVTEGFRRLLRALTDPKTWAQDDQIISENDPQSMLERFSIADEQMGPPYKLTLNLHYDRDAVRALLNKLQIPYSEVKAGRVLIVPLLDLPAGMILWEGDNPWKAALAQAISTDSAGHFMLPVGDAREQQALTPEMAAFGAGDVMTEIAHYYNADEAVVARLHMGYGANQNNLVMDANWYGSNSGMQPQTLNLPDKVQSFTADALQPVANEVVASLEQQWRQAYQLNFDKATTLQLTYPDPDLGQLASIESRLENLSIVKSLQLQDISRKALVFNVDLLGSPEKFADQVHGTGLWVTSSNTPQGWLLSTATPQPTDGGVQQ